MTESQFSNTLLAAMFTSVATGVNHDPS